MKKINQATVYYLYCGISAGLFIMMKTVREIYRFDIARLDAFQIVIVGTILEITHLIFEVPTGILADKVSRKLSVVIGLFLIGCSILIEGIFPLFIIICLTQISLGIGDTFTSGADEAWIIDELERKDVTNVFLKGTQISQWFSIIGTLFSIYFGLYNIQTPYFISGILFILLSIFLSIYMKETHFIKKTSTINKFKYLLYSLKSDIKLIKGSKVLLFIVFITLFHGLYSEGIDRLWTPHFIEEVKLPGNNVLVIGIISLLSMFFSIIIVEYTKRRFQKTKSIERIWLLLILNILMVVTLFAFAISQQFYITVGLYIIFYTVRKLNQPLFRTYMNEHIPSDIRATTLSTFGIIDALGQIIGGPIIGLIALNTSISFGIVFSSIILSPVIFIYLYFIKIMIKYDKKARLS